MKKIVFAIIMVVLIGCGSSTETVYVYTNDNVAVGQNVCENECENIIGNKTYFVETDAQMVFETNLKAKPVEWVGMWAAVENVCANIAGKICINAKVGTIYALMLGEQTPEDVVQNDTNEVFESDIADVQGDTNEVLEVINEHDIPTDFEFISESNYRNFCDCEYHDYIKIGNYCENPPMEKGYFNGLIQCSDALQTFQAVEIESPYRYQFKKWSSDDESIFSIAICCDESCIYSWKIVCLKIALNTDCDNMFYELDCPEYVK